MKKFSLVLGVDNNPADYMLGLPPAVRDAMLRGVPAGVIQANGTREFILSQHKPAHANVFCRHITMAYGVMRHYPVPQGSQRVTFVGEVNQNGAQALIVLVNDKLRREDGKLFHLTISTAPGVPPATAGDFRHDTSGVRWFGSSELFELDLWAFLAPRFPIKAEEMRAVA